MYLVKLIQLTVDTSVISNIIYAFELTVQLACETLCMCNLYIAVFLRA